MPLILLLIWIAAVAYQSKFDDAMDLAGEDIPGFAPWLASVGFLWALSKIGALKPIITPFFALAIIATIVIRFPAAKKELNTTYEVLTDG